MLKHAVLAISSLAFLNAVTVPRSGPSCAAPDNSKVDWVGCAVDNAWYGVSKRASYDHFSAEFRLCAFLGGHVAWMKEENEDSCAAQAMIATNTVDEYVVLSGDYQEDEGGWVWPHSYPFTYDNWFAGSTQVGDCMGSYYDGKNYGWLKADCFEKSKAMCRVDC